MNSHKIITLILLFFVIAIYAQESPFDGIKLRQKLNTAKKLNKAVSGCFKSMSFDDEEDQGQGTSSQEPQDTSICLAMMITMSDLMEKITYQVNEVLAEQGLSECENDDDPDDDDSDSEDELDGEPKKEHQQKTLDALEEAVDHCYHGYRDEVVNWKKEGVKIERVNPECRKLREIYRILRQKVEAQEAQ